MTEWNGNDGAPWVALTLTTFDALISPVATLSDIGDSGLGIFLKLDGTSAMGGDLDMGGFGILDVADIAATGLTVESSGNGELFVSRISGANINFQAQSARGVIGTNTNHPLDFKTNSATRMSLLTSGVASFNHDIDMNDNQIINVQNLVGNATSLIIGQNWLFAIAPGAFKDSLGANRIIFQTASIDMESASFLDGAYITSYDPTPPLYGGGDTFWYQQRNIRFKDTAGPPSDAEGQDGDVCLIYTF